MTTSTHLPTLYFLLPVYNESRSIYDLLIRINDLAKYIPYPICALPIDDASKDDSAQWIQKASKDCDRLSVKPLTHPINKGLPEALNTGLCALEPLIQKDDFVVTMDGDNTHPPHLVLSMIQKHKEGADLVLSSRYLEQSVVSGVSRFRLLLSFGARILYHLFWRFPGVRDYTCLFRSHRGSLLQTFYQTTSKPYLKQEGFACTTEFLAKLMAQSPVTVEVPLILTYGNKVGASNVRILQTILTSLKILFRKMP